MLPIKTLVFSALVALTTAQNYTYTFPSGFNLAKVTSTDKAAWCLSERNTCPLICGGVADSNNCDSTTLDFTCVCGNGTAADVGLYQGTIPFYVCQANFGQCIDASTTQDQDAACKADNVCGSLNASDISSSSTSTTSSTPTSTASSNTQESTTTAASTTSSTASASTHNAAVRMAQDYSTGLVATALFFAARLLL